MGLNVVVGICFPENPSILRIVIQTIYVAIPKTASFVGWVVPAGVSNASKTIAVAVRSLDRPPRRTEVIALVSHSVGRWVSENYRLRFSLS